VSDVSGIEVVNVGVVGIDAERVDDWYLNDHVAG
jgi:hypothetical protein